jgi:hypothetical protein
MAGTTLARTDAARGAGWLKAAVLVLAVAALGLPINSVWAYGLLLVLAVLVFTGEIRMGVRRWMLAAAACAFAALLPHAIAPPPIVEGDNLFLPGKPGNVLERGLPKDVYAFLSARFDAVYPPSVRCTGDKLSTCWDSQKFPDRVYAFAADGVFGNGGASREVSHVDFSDPVWLRLGFVNDLGYNWGTDAPDVHRGDRDRRFWMGFRRWHIAMPFFLMLKLPAAYAGSNLCWRGDVLWPDAAGNYTPLAHADMTCRRVAADDIGRPIFGSSIAPESLAMRLDAPAGVQIRNAVCALAAVAAILVLLLATVRIRLRKVLPIAVLVGLALAVIAIDDMSFIGGWRPMDGGDDGLFYTGIGRQILQHLVGGDIRSALIGGESIYYYGGPGLRYFRALEGIVFGDTNLGYLSIVLLMPWLVWRLFARFLSENFAWRIALLFTALPLGEIFGTSFFHYSKWAARGFADPLAHILLVWGIVIMAGTREKPAGEASVAGAAMLLALAVFVKPIVAPMAGIVMLGAWLIAVAARDWRRAGLLCLGFTPVLLMPLHNLYFGHKFVLLSSNAQLPGTYVMPPAGYLAALGELVRLDFRGADLHAAVAQIGAFLSGPSGFAVFIPLHLAAVAVVIALTLRGRDMDRWLRVIGAAVIAQYGAALIYAATARYFFPMWLLTCLIVCVFVEQRLPSWLEARGFGRARGLLDRSLGVIPAANAS